jgi:hypothetical protein
MSALLPLMGKHQIVREFRLGTGKTADAVIKTLRTNGAISDGLRSSGRGRSGQLTGSCQLYCALNRDAAQAFRRKDVQLALRYAQAAARVEALDVTREMVQEIALRGVDSSPASLAGALSDGPMFALAQRVLTAIDAERVKLPQVTVTTLTGTVINLSDDGAVIELTMGGTRLPMPRSVLAEEGLARLGANLAARWELAGDGMMVMAVEPVIDAPDGADEEPLVDMYGTPWGKVLTTSDALFAKSLLERPDSEKHAYRPRVNIPIGE